MKKISSKPIPALTLLRILALPDSPAYSQDGFKEVEKYIVKHLAENDIPGLLSSRTATMGTCSRWSENYMP